LDLNEELCQPIIQEFLIRRKHGSPILEGTKEGWTWVRCNKLYFSNHALTILHGWSLVNLSPEANHSPEYHI
jgi:hypothetical protein